MAELDAEDVVAPEAEPEEEVTDLMGAVRGVLKKSLMVDGAIRGLHEVAKHIEACKAQVVFLSESCNEATYKKLIQGLCVEKNVPVIDVPDNKSLGEWAGLCKIDKDGMPRKVVGASCVAIVDFGEEGEEQNRLVAASPFCAQSCMTQAYNFMMKIPLLLPQSYLKFKTRPRPRATEPLQAVSEALFPAMKGVKAAVRGAQETLGFDSPSHMKGLQVFIADIRNCQTKEQERTRVDKELSKIRQKFANPKTLSGYDRKKYVWKLLYAYMLGYEIDDTGHFQAVELCSSPKFSEKTAGYLATSLLLADNNDMVRMIVNSVKTDISSGNEHMAALALNTVANIGGPEFADNLFTDIARMILTQANALSPYVKRKACICLLRLYRKENDGLQPEVWSPKLAVLFNEQDIGLLTSASGFMLGILEMGKFPATGPGQGNKETAKKAVLPSAILRQPSWLWSLD
ncbi:ALPHAC-AD [Symbiodinium necroappetens]|uniref:40S ribosomal protein S12 n=1 Tax=Symbiodinium necroappetens TaxID=1628268 RepID=A0A812XZE5_9DINO|nr:ALPHAC-AD [Symbiodinium necroappetens]